MKVIFLENLEDHKIGDVKEVSDGYARNFLLRRGIAEIATAEKVKEVEAKMSKLKKEEAEKVKEAKELVAKLKKENIILLAEVNEEGHLYGSLSAKEVAEKLEEMGYEIGGEDIEMEESIKELGEYEVLVKVGHGVETNLKVKVDRAE